MPKVLYISIYLCKDCGEVFLRQQFAKRHLRLDKCKNYSGYTIKIESSKGKALNIQLLSGGIK